jgi:hypothetical protein
MASSSANDFPQPFNSLRQISGGGDRPFVVGAMFTASYAENAERLAASCAKFGLHHAIHEVPVIHRSISCQGTDDLAYTKPNFIHHLMAAHGKPILYVDADCEFVDEPDLIVALVRSDCDFAIYNWLADECTDTFKALELGVGVDGPPIKNRFFRYWRSIDWFSTTQLFGSGCVQLYGNSALARQLLTEWHRNIALYPGAADDGCLDLAFNNRESNLHDLTFRWLPKAYARISWWIYAKPVINHAGRPQPDANFKDLSKFDTGGRKFWYPERTEFKTVTGPFPRDCIIDVERRVIAKIVGDQLVTVGITDRPFWI